MPGLHGLLPDAGAFRARGTVHLLLPLWFFLLAILPLNVKIASHSTAQASFQKGASSVIYFADLHIHSKYSRATSRDCNLIELARWAALKGILVLATGDFTHPQWRSEIKEMLEEADDGLLRLKKLHVPSMEPLPKGFGPADVRFMLNVEISSIYKKDGATRKVHNLIFMPDLASMDRFSEKLDRIGNIKSDGRPILGLDSRHLLEIALEASSDTFLVPAHVWTPWFSILGSKSGFDSIEECFEDLTPHIFALETGLSSDPVMNHRVTSLDRYTLISNSDTHSPQNIAREANIFEGVPGYFAIRDALRAGAQGILLKEDAETPLDSTGGGTLAGSRPEAGTRKRDRGFIGTIEFFPEEGKYHLDGHRKCATRLEPEQTAEHGGRCPVCGQPVTIGVMNRVMELADRPMGEKPPRAAPFWRLLPIREIVAQSLGVGPQSLKVRTLYDDLLVRLGPELNILWATPLDEISRQAPEIVAEGISRARQGRVSILAGYDGEYGTVELFTPSERDELLGQQSLVPIQTTRGRQTRGSGGSSPKAKKRAKSVAEAKSTRPRSALNQEQAEAVHICDRPVLVQAGPGTGKTRTLTERVATLIRAGKAQGSEITAVTFTRKAAGEMRERLTRLIPEASAQGCWVGTFHQLGSRILDTFRSNGHAAVRERVLEEDEAISLFRKAIKEARIDCPPARVTSLYQEVSLLKQQLVTPEVCTERDDLARAYRAYEDTLARERAFDLDDLVSRPVQLLRESPSEAASISETVAEHLLVDEFQDVNKAQYELVRLLSKPSGEGLFVIGDPNQAIYGFRGADWRFFSQFQVDYPSVRILRLSRNYRSQGNILTAAANVMNQKDPSEILSPEIPADKLVSVVELPNPATEGTFITRAIDSMMGGSSFFSLDSGRATGGDDKLDFSEFAVLYRLNAVGDLIEEAFRTSGIPYQRACKQNPRDESEAIDPRARVVTLMTIHAAKGLEFPVVFVAGCEEGVIPYLREPGPDNPPDEIDDERRLMYVAMTRASRELVLTRAATRTLFGQTTKSAPSRFLSCVDTSVCRHMKPLADRPRNRGKAPSQCDLFAD
jgi:DNA helicase-2/ATP-dependent DNA helicase PcrA